MYDENFSGGGGKAGFYLGFLAWGEVDPEKGFEPRGSEKKILGLLGGLGACSPGIF